MVAKSHHNYFVFEYFYNTHKIFQSSHKKNDLECADDQRIYSHYIISHMNYSKCDININCCCCSCCYSCRFFIDQVALAIKSECQLEHVEPSLVCPAMSSFSS